MNQFERGRAVRRAASLTPREKLLLWELNDTQGEDAFAFTKQDTLASQTGIEVRNLRKLLAALEERGWLTRGYTPNPDPRKRPLRTYAVVVPAVGEGRHDPVEGSDNPAVQGHHDPAKEGRHDPTVTAHGTDHLNVGGSARARVHDPAPPDMGDPPSMPRAARPPARAVSDPKPSVPRSLDPGEYHKAHPVVAAIERTWADAYAQLSGGRKYTARGHGDTVAVQRLAHWCVRHCDVNGGSPEDVAGRVVGSFLATRWDPAKPPAMTWLDPDHPMYPLDPAGHLEGGRGGGVRAGRPKGGRIPAPPNSVHGDPTPLEKLDFSGSRRKRAAPPDPAPDDLTPIDFSTPRRNSA